MEGDRISEREGLKDGLALHSHRLGRSLSFEVRVLPRYLLIFFFYIFKNCCSSIVVSIFPPPFPTSPSIPTFHLQSYPLWLCPCDLYTCSLKTLLLFSPIIPLPTPLWLLSVCSVSTVIFWLFICFID